jgi:hypothetical protein
MVRYVASRENVIRRKEATMLTALTEELLDLTASAQGHRNALYGVTVYLCCSCSSCWGGGKK